MINVNSWDLPPLEPHISIFSILYVAFHAETETSHTLVNSLTFVLSFPYCFRSLFHYSKTCSIVSNL